MTPYFKHGTYRATPQPRHELPLGARSVGHYRLAPGEADGVRVKHFTQVFWSIAGTGLMGLRGGTVRLRPGWIALYFPGDRHEVRAGANDWEYRWWTMDGPLGAALVKGFGLEGGRTYYVGAAPVRLFQKLERHIKDLSKAGELRASAAAYEMVAAAGAAVRLKRTVASARPPEGDFAAQVTTLIEEAWYRPEFGIAQLADAVSLHRSVLSRRFKSIFGVTPSDYLRRRRIQHALALLKETSLPAEEIAGRSGWSDPNYFSRCIRQATGMSPRRFREG